MGVPGVASCLEKLNGGAISAFGSKGSLLLWGTLKPDGGSGISIRIFDGTYNRGFRGNWLPCLAWSLQLLQSVCQQAGTNLATTALSMPTSWHGRCNYCNQHANKLAQTLQLLQSVCQPASQKATKFWHGCCNLFNASNEGVGILTAARSLTAS